MIEVTEVKVDHDMLHVVLRTAEVEAQLLAGAEQVAEAAADIARREAIDSGEYASSITATTTGTADGKLAGEVRVSDWKGHWIEYGTATRPATATIRRALQQVMGPGVRILGGGATRKSRGKPKAST